MTNDKISLIAIFDLTFLPESCTNSCVVNAHAEPVEVWGLEPCGRLVLPSQSRVWQGPWPRAAPVGLRVRHIRGQTSLICTFVSTGAWQFCRAETKDPNNEQKSLPPAAAPPAQPRLALEADRRLGSGSSDCCTSLDLVVRPAMSGDLENSRREYRNERNKTSNDKRCASFAAFIYGAFAKADRCGTRSFSIDDL